MVNCEPSAGPRRRAWISSPTSPPPPPSPSRSPPPAPFSPRCADCPGRRPSFPPAARERFSVTMHVALLGVPAFQPETRRLAEGRDGIPLVRVLKTGAGECAQEIMHAALLANCPRPFPPVPSHSSKSGQAGSLQPLWRRGSALWPCRPHSAAWSGQLPCLQTLTMVPARLGTRTRTATGEVEHRPRRRNADRHRQNLQQQG